MRIGSGFDAHAYRHEGYNCKGIVIAGIRIPGNQSIVAHSDGDVLLHAICDALLGAAAEGDIGLHFPNTEETKGISGLVLLEKTFNLITAKQLYIVNLDATLIAESPFFSPFIGKIRKNIANVLNIDVNCVSIKATTTDQLGFIGRGEGIAAIASVLLK